MKSPVSTAKRTIKKAAQKSGLLPAVHRLLNLSKETHTCPICAYSGPFMDQFAETGNRKNARCPKCDALERHRIQALVLKILSEKHDLSSLSLLHFAPEAFFQKFFKDWFGEYATADLDAPDVDFNVDLTGLPFADSSYDCVIASHVLEHIKDDRKALSEIRRVLRPGGFAILPVPLVAMTTVEYPEPNPHEEYHVRAPGYDYYDRYRDYFDLVDEYRSSDLPEMYQLYSYEDRSRWPTPTMPLRPPSPGEKHAHIIPVCYLNN